MAKNGTTNAVTDHAFLKRKTKKTVPLFFDQVILQNDIYGILIANYTNCSGPHPPSPIGEKLLMKVVSVISMK